VIPHDGTKTLAAPSTSTILETFALSSIAQVRQAAERGIGVSGFGAAAYMKPLLQNLALSLGNNEEVRRGAWLAGWQTGQIFACLVGTGMCLSQGKGAAVGTQGDQWGFGSG
jgi:hypothetical protein